MLFPITTVTTEHGEELWGKNIEAEIITLWVSVDRK